MGALNGAGGGSGIPASIMKAMSYDQLALWPLWLGPPWWGWGWGSDRVNPPFTGGRGSWFALGSPPSEDLGSGVRPGKSPLGGGRGGWSASWMPPSWGRWWGTRWSRRKNPPG